MTANDDFFQRKQAAVVLKHGILTRYPPIFATMTGSTSSGGRVVYLDGYAGPGRYEPEASETVGAPGSPLLAVQNASTVAKWSRNLHCIFVERNTKFAKNLREVLAQESPATLKYDVMKGDLADRLDEALVITGDSPPLAFLDPFGTALPYRQMVDRLMLRGANLKTEVLLNLNLEMVWGIGGYLTGEEADHELNAANRSATLERVDNFLGGNWWRETFRRSRASGPSGSSAAAAQEVASEYCNRIKDATGFNSFVVPIRRRPHHEPLFLMILFYRHPSAPYQFNDSASGADSDWREHFRQLDLQEELAKQQIQPDLFGGDFAIEVSERDARDVERKLDQTWSGEIADTASTTISGLIRTTPSPSTKFSTLPRVSASTSTPCTVNHPPSSRHGLTAVLLAVSVLGELDQLHDGLPPLATYPVNDLGSRSRWARVSSAILPDLSQKIWLSHLGRYTLSG